MTRKKSSVRADYWVRHPAVRLVACPRCDAAPGQKCTTTLGAITEPHTPRVKQAMTAETLLEAAGVEWCRLCRSAMEEVLLTTYTRTLGIHKAKVWKCVNADCPTGRFYYEFSGKRT